MKNNGVLVCGLLLLAGCGSSVSIPPAPVYPNITGNWSITAVSSVTNQPVQIGGYLTNNGTSITGTVHLIGSSCFNISTDVAVTGTITTGGAISITSAAVASQSIKASGPITSGKLSGTYTITGGCANGDKGTLNGFITPSFSGSYTGTFM